jgi:hypothetical protein
MLKTAAALTLGLPLLCQAGLSGTSVTGTLRFFGPTNYFDPANNRVPSGVGNTVSNQVTIGDPLVEFGFDDGYSRITADFTAFRLAIAEAAHQNVGAEIERYTFSDNAFVGRVAVPVSNSYPVTPTVDLNDDFLTVNFPSGYDLTAGNTTTFTLALTLPGDADLNGTVDFNDFLVLQNHFGQPNTTFATGDFNFDQQTDFNDFLALQNNFGTSVAGTPFVATAAEVKAMTAFAAVVPEPAGLAALGLGWVAIRRRRVVGRASPQDV